MPNSRGITNSSPDLETIWEIQPASNTPSLHSVENSPRSLADTPNTQTIPVEGHPALGESSSAATVIQPPQAANTALRGNFADRHPKLTMGLAGVAAKFAFFSTTLALTPLFWVAAPVRFFVTAVGIISPQLALSLAKTQGIKQALGLVANELIRITGRGLSTNTQRQKLAKLLGLDVVSLGLSLSAVSALDVASSTAKEVRKQTAKTLGFTEAQINGYVARHNARAADRKEDRALAKAMAAAPPVMKSIHAFFDVLGPEETPKTGLDEQVWTRYEKKHANSTSSSKAFSALLQKNKDGFAKFDNNSNSFQNDLNKTTYKTFVKERLLPVLLAMQGSEKIAKNAFEWAERGLGSCRDRAASVWLTLELSTLSLKYSERILNMLARSPELTPRLEHEITKLIKIERQRFRLNEAMRFTDHYIQDAQRDPRKGGWQSRDTFKPYADLDHVEVILDVCARIQKENHQWFPSFPYKCYGSGFTTTDTTTLKNKVAGEVRKISLDRTHTKFLEHLKTTDAWKSIFTTLHPSIDMRNLEAVRLCEEAVGELDNLSDVFPHTERGGEYANAMEGIAALRRKFNAEPLPANDAALPPTDFMNKQMSLRAPALARAQVEVGQGDKHAILHQANQTWVKLQSESKALAELLNQQIESHTDLVLPSQLTTQEVGLLHSVLEQIELLTTQLSKLPPSVQEKMQKDILEDFKNEGGKLTRILKGVGVFSSAQNFVNACEQLKAEPLNNDRHQVINNFTLQYIDKISRDPLLNAGYLAYN